jgi:integrase
MFPSRRTPALRRHKPSGLAVVTLDGKDHYLGPWPSGQRKPPAAAQAEYDRLISEWLAHGRRVPETEDGDPLTVSGLILAFWGHAEQHYRRPDGTPTSELADYKLSLRPLRELYGRLAVPEFSPRKLKAVRERMIEANLCRGVINQRVGRIVRVFKWGVGEELVPETVHRALAAVPGLQKGRSKARESEPVKPVPAAWVEATLPHVLPPVRAMARLQQLTGARPGEICALRGCDIDMSGPVWLYRPQVHKTMHAGKDRVIAVGPRAQEALKPWLRLNLTEYLFQPREAVAALRAGQRRHRKGRVRPSQASRRNARPKKVPGERYTSRSYAQAIAKGVLAANTARACGPCKPLKPEARCEACKAAAVPHWHPHMLRHSHATAVRRQFGLEAARVALGHHQTRVTEVYTERDLALAAKVAREIG